MARWWRVVPDPDEAKSLELFRLVITDPEGGELGHLEVVRRNTGCLLTRMIWRADEIAWACAPTSRLGLRPYIAELR
jgi:hypothetical protein